MCNMFPHDETKVPPLTITDKCLILSTFPEKAKNKKMSSQHKRFS